MSTPPRRLESAAQAIAAAHEIAGQIAELARDRHNNRQLPRRQAQLLSDSGLTAIGVPAQFGGLGASVQTIVETVRIVSAADGGVGQLLQIHNVMLRGVLSGYPDEVRERLIADLLAGKRLGNALAEVGGKNKFALKTRIERREDGKLVLNGSKFYSTGSYLAEWISLTAASDDGGAGVLLHRDTPGLTLLDDWDAFGQNNSVSGTVQFDNIELDERYVLRRQGPMKRTGLTFPQILHAAIDTGIAAGALQAGIDYLNQHARPWVESEVERASEEPHIIRQIGEYAVALRAAESLLRDAARTFDAHELAPDDKALQDELILSVATARAHSDAASLKISSDIFSLLGASASLSKWNLDRFWRNARVHTTHDPIRWRLHHVGNYYLNGIDPGEYTAILAAKQSAGASR
ncbi:MULTISPECIES: acyl-CoA dehydrogenase family protein [Pseudomonas]|jgi:alkylation response protein AidB-like acyl-CoA dehydrogenase|uniref:Dibenzothiophene monooxygenase n=2 Tax=Pseudomonas TaxID=286 RepID=A0A9X8HMH1_PSEPU|nr:MULTISPECIES: acyl-CoA dehydrogenase family protein [Pseudomonas]MBG8559446.1 acyl-CoA dehydrogenase family protein [Pseudomonas qingdaonensis]MCO7505766.1 acyl-CoA dehydrogenase family protein [Pseudomonas sp. VE 267-6A]MCO7530602.1 acyl-CoA dehydrogenase family protein [Pseudomonas sp. 2]MCP8350939.1 monooxygenase [Pseudomonas sp. FBF18]OUM24347.1 monooxygenase [Pseudomonas sp. 1239]